MVNYRRQRIAGGSFFFTVILHDRQSRTLTDHIDVLRAAFRYTQCRRPFIINAIVILPEHLHTVWTLPPDDADYSGRWRAIKSRFTRTLCQRGISIPRHASGEYTLWQRRFWEHTLRDADDRERHVDYIHYNPVKHGYVSSVADWPFSSFHRYVRRGLLPVDWAGNGEFDEGEFGE
ncbi:MAG: transposase [Gammaproteobacteria bacterium]|nr:transposase [Gammaproteobacteria bacterium]